ncbi:glycosyltransferase family 61 protein [Isoptericola sp. F-RaC21]|uniref:glycosyltransferase family 61 protein n=1 Tax=Isoptericola sp. F-RaC21 TaxID=3141452 RepID=UPI00315BF5D0
MRFLRRLNRPAVQPAQGPVVSAAPAHELLQDGWTTHLDRDVVRDVVLVLGGGSELDRGRAYAEAMPGATVHLLPVRDVGRATALPPNLRVAHCRALRDRVDYLRTIPRPQVIVENGTNKRSQKVGCLRELFLFLADGGVYTVESIDKSADPALHDSPGMSIVELLEHLRAIRDGVAEPRRSGEAELADCLARLTFSGTVAVATKQHDHAVKLRERDADAVLSARFGSSWGKVLEVRGSEEFRPVTVLTNHGSGPRRQRAMVKVPERRLREYQDVLCSSRQRVQKDGYYLPDTFRHPLQRRLNHRDTIDSTAVLARDRDAPISRRRLEGTYFHLDTEYPGHFGHVTTEVLGRVWGWRQARDRFPEVRPLVSLAEGASTIPAFQRDLFDALGVPTGEIEYVRPDEVVHVPHLLAASSDFAMPQFAAPSVASLWEEARRGLPAADVETHDLIFSSRRPGGVRTCANTSDVEQVFRDLGFHVFFPEDHSIADQAALFSGARLVAGFGGSNLFSALFAGRAPRVVVSGTSYDANNEQLMAEVQGADIDYVWGESEVRHPPRGWSWPAFRSGFSVDVARLRSALDQILSR